MRALLEDVTDLTVRLSMETIAFDVGYYDPLTLFADVLQQVTQTS